MRAPILLALLVVGGTAGAADAPPFDVAAVPGWVREEPVDLEAAVPEGEIEGGAYDLLIDDQRRIAPGVAQRTGGAGLA